MASLYRGVCHGESEGSGMFGLKARDRDGAQAYSHHDRSSVPGGGIASGIVAGTRIATTMGWRPVEGIVAGDSVLTFDGGLQRVARVDHATLWTSQTACPRPLWPLKIPPGALGNKTEAMLLPEQVVMIEDDIAEEILGDPFVLIPAAALDGLGGARAVAPTGTIGVVTLYFDEEQVVFADLGVMFFCPGVQQAACLTRIFGEETDAPYRPLPLQSAEALIACIEADRGTAPAFWSAMPGEIAQAARADFSLP